MDRRRTNPRAHASVSQAEAKRVLEAIEKLKSRLLALEKTSTGSTRLPDPPTSGVRPSDDRRQSASLASRDADTQSVLEALMGSGSTAPSTRAPWSTDLSRSLFPGRPDGQLAAEHATVLVKDALIASRKRQSFGSFEKFHTAFKPWFASLVHGDSQRAMHCFNYYAFLVTLAFEKSWEAAEAYHWLLFERMERGEYDLANGPVDHMCLRKVDHAYPTGQNNEVADDSEEDLDWCEHELPNYDRNEEHSGTEAPGCHENVNGEKTLEF